MLEAVRPTDRRSSRGGVIWICKCDCGNIVERESATIVRQESTHCGCARKKRTKKYEPWDECFAWRPEKGKCDCLTEPLCVTKGTCNFFAPKEEV